MDCNRDRGTLQLDHYLDHHQNLIAWSSLAEVKFMERKKILTSKMNLDLRKRIVKCLVWSVALYAAEMRTISKTDMKRIEAFEM